MKKVNKLEIKYTIAQQLAMKITELDDNVPLCDYRADSLDMAEIEGDIADAYWVDFDKHEITVNDTVNSIVRKLEAKSENFK